MRKSNKGCTWKVEKRRIPQNVLNKIIRDIENRKPVKVIAAELNKTEQFVRNAVTRYTTGIRRIQYEFEKRNRTDDTSN